MGFLRWLGRGCECVLILCANRADVRFRFPLFSKGVDTYRFEYGVFLLNKDIELVSGYAFLQGVFADVITVNGGSRSESFGYEAYAA